MKPKRDAYLVEMMRGTSDLPEELVDRFEQSGDILYFGEICDKIRATLKLQVPLDSVLREKADAP